MNKAMTDAATPAQPRTAAAVTRDWLSGAMLVGMGSVEQGEYEGQPKYEAAADEAIRWLTDNGMSLAIEAQARPAVASEGLRADGIVAELMGVEAHLDEARERLIKANLTLAAYDRAAGEGEGGG